MNNEILELAYSNEEISNIIGKRGEKIREIEKILKIKVKINDKIIINRGESDLNDFELVNIFDALALGFKAKEAALLKDPEYLFEKINLKIAVRPSRRKIIKARIIGKEGKTRRIIEELTGCHAIIFGNYIGLIGKHENLTAAKRAIQKLVRGQRHEAVYNWLQQETKKLEESKELTEKQLKEIK